MLKRTAFAAISLLALVGCGQGFEKKYAENCKRTGLSSDEVCDCVARDLDAALDSSQKDMILNGAEKINQSTMATSVSILKPTTEAFAACAGKVHRESLEKMSPDARCKAAKQHAISQSQRFFLSLMEGKTGYSTPGMREAESAAKEAGAVCGIANYTPSDLIDEVKYDGTRFVLKE